MNIPLKVTLCSLLLVFPQIVNSTAIFAAPVANSQRPYVNPEPIYAKWGKLAISETQKRYPRATVIDYLHVGRQALSPSTTQEVFKLWLKADRQELGVYVRILFNTKTEHILNVSFQETER